MQISIMVLFIYMFIQGDFFLLKNNLLLASLDTVDFHS